MALVAKLFTDAVDTGRVDQSLRPIHDTLGVVSRGAFRRLVRDRPIASALIDPDALGEDAGPWLARLCKDFPSLRIVLACSLPVRPRALFEIHRHCDGLPMFVMGIDNWARLHGLLASRATRALSNVLSTPGWGLGPREAEVVRMAAEWSHRRWPTDRMAREFGLTRPFLSECLKARGLPSLGHLMVWARLVHAAEWLGDPGRSVASVARQLEYADAAGLRRAFRRYLGATPTRIVTDGGAALVATHFLARCVAAGAGAKPVEQAATRAVGIA